jgi:hypothetical protein
MRWSRKIMRLQSPLPVSWSEEHNTVQTDNSHPQKNSSNHPWSPVHSTRRCIVQDMTADPEGSHGYNRSCLSLRSRVTVMAHHSALKCWPKSSIQYHLTTVDRTLGIIVSINASILARCACMVHVSRQNGNLGNRNTQERNDTHGMPDDTTDCWCHLFANDAITEVITSYAPKQRMQSHDYSLSRR